GRRHPRVRFLRGDLVLDGRGRPFHAAGGEPVASPAARLRGSGTPHATLRRARHRQLHQGHHRHARGHPARARRRLLVRGARRRGTGPRRRGCHAAGGGGSRVDREPRRARRGRARVRERELDPDAPRIPDDRRRPAPPDGRRGRRPADAGPARNLRGTGFPRERIAAGRAAARHHDAARRQGRPAHGGPPGLHPGAWRRRPAGVRAVAGATRGTRARRHPEDGRRRSRVPDGARRPPARCRSAGRARPCGGRAHAPRRGPAARGRALRRMPVPAGSAARAERARRHLYRRVRVCQARPVARGGDPLGRRAHQPEARARGTGAGIGGRRRAGAPRALPGGGDVRRAGLAALLAALAGCAGAPREAPPEPVSILLFGDTGYDYDWLEADEYANPLDARTFVIEELDDWIEDYRPIEEFRIPPMHRLEATGGWVMASGQRPVAQAATEWCAAPGRCRFAIMLGDNVYPAGGTAGADGREDAERFDALLRRPYEPLQQQDPDFVIYPVLGNHDWDTSREGAMAQVAWLEQSPLYDLDGIFYRRRPAPDVEVFLIDTTVL